MNVLICWMLSFMFSLPLIAQQTIVRGVQMVRPSNGAVQTLTTDASTNQTVVLPNAASTANGQGLKIAAVSGSTVTLEWDTPTAGLKNSSSQLAADAVDAADYSTGPEISVVSGKNYRIVGVFQMQRGTTLNTANDLFELRLNVPSASTSATFFIDCFDCPAGTTGVPSFSSGATSAGANPAVNGPVIDLGGSSSGLPFTFRIEGFLSVGATGKTRLTFNKSGGGGENVVMLAGSYWALQEIE